MLLCWVFLMVYQVPIGFALDDMHNDEVLLEEAFQQIGREYGVFFSYDRSVVSTVKVKYESEKYKNVEDALSYVLEQTDLEFQIFDKRYVAVYRDTEEGVESLKKMVEHFQGIIDKKEKEVDRKSGIVNTLQTYSVREIYNKRLVINLSGKVTDQNGEPLIGVNVLVEGTNKGASTDFNGNFTLEDIDENAVLIFSYIGYQTQEVTLNGEREITIILLEDSQTLDEVVVVGYGIQKKVNLTGAVGVIEADQLENRPIASVEEALQGQVPGLNIVRTSGTPGNQAIDFKIRGTSTFTGNPVLVVIDGVPSASNELDRLNPNDIESISVLKDAASAAIYGSRATGGVILVTTKSGKVSDGKPRISLNSTVGIQSPTRFPEKVSAVDHALLSNEARLNDGSGIKFTDAEIASFSSPDFKGENWDDFMLNDALQSNHNLSISGGNEYMDYYISAGYLKQNGTVINTDYERMNVRFNQNLKIFENLKLGLKATYSPSVRTEGAFGSTTSMLTNVASLESLYAVKSESGKWLDNRGTGGSSIATASADGGDRKVKNNLISGIITLDYEVLPGLVLTGNYGLNRTQMRQRDYQKILTIYNQDNPSEIAGQNEFNRLNIENEASIFQNASIFGRFNKKFGRHDLTILGGFSSEWFLLENDVVGTRDFLSDNIYTIGAGSQDPSFWTIGGGATDWALESYISRFNYSYDEKYLFETAVRYDGSSRFVKSERWGLFPSVSLGWIVSKERFLANNELLSYLKLRGSWGQVGNQNVGFYPFASSLSQGVTYFDGLPHRTVQSSGAANADLTWETKESINFGLDFGLFSDIVRFEFDVFKEKTSDILLQLPLPTTFGQSAPVQNAGVVENKGWEVSLIHKKYFNDFNYSITFNVSDAKNKVVDMGGISPRISGNTITEEGYSIDEWFGIEADGFFQSIQEVENHAEQNPQTSPGDIRFIDQNNDGEINSDDRVRLGLSNPRFPYGITINLGYKNFNFSAFGQGVAKNVVWSNGWTIQNFDRENSTLRTYHLDRWTPETPNSRFPLTRMGSGASDSGINDRFSSFWLEDAAYFRIKHIELGYTLPQNLIETIKLDRLHLFVSGENLITFTDYLGYDPEVGNGTSSRLVERRYPLSKVISFGLNVNF